MHHTRKVIYLMSGSAHLPYLVTSLRTLRHHYNGPVEVHAWEQSYNQCQLIAADDRLYVTAHFRIPHEDVEKIRVPNRQTYDRISMFVDSEDDYPVVYLDADTIIAGSIDPLFDAAAEYGHVATQFNDWKSHHGIAHGRVKRLLEFPGIDPTCVHAVLNNPWPSVNGGVFSAVPSRSTYTFRKWQQWTWEARSMFIPDEVVLHPLQVVPGVYTLTGGRFNCSAMYKFIPKALDFRDVVIWHGHGNCFARPNKAPQWHDEWKRQWLICMRDNLGECKSWGADAMLSHKFFKKRLVEYGFDSAEVT